MDKKGLIYSFVAKGTIVLAEHTLYSGNCSTMAVQCLQKLPSSGNKYTYTCDGNTFYFLKDNEFVFLVVAEEAAGRSLPYVFLERVKDDFKQRYAGSIKSRDAHPLADENDSDDDLFEDRFSIAYNLAREFGPKLKEHMHYCMSHPEEMSRLSKNRDQGEDRISDLPDDILLSIMSSIRMEEAVKTSILSKRWRYLWANRTHLHFNHLLLLPEIFADALLTFATTDQKTKYINWVNQVVDLHCSPFIDTFKVQFQFDSNAAHHIDKWVRFATLKKVKHLELISHNNGPVGNNDLYTIGIDVLKPSPSPSPGDGDISFLMSLHLNGINISGDVLEFLLSRCCLLERLSVEDSDTLERLKISGPCYKLKHLTIAYCFNLEELEIDAANLVSFTYLCVNHDSSFVFKSVPMLVEVKVGHNLESILPRVFHLAGQLSKLSLVLKEWKIPGGFLPNLSYLKQLALKFPDVEIDLVAVTTWLESCPMVHEFKIQMCWHSHELETEAYELKILDLGEGEGEGNEDEDEDDEDEDDDDEDEGEDEEDGVFLPPKTHPNLKVLHVAGFMGSFGDVSLILYFVQFACHLETIICDSSRRYDDYEDPDFVEASRSRASKIVKIVPPKIRVEII